MTYTGVGEEIAEPVPPEPTAQWVKANTNLTGASASSIQVDKDTNMIPVVNKDTRNNYPNNWCNYDQKPWCNAVTVTSASLATYQSATTGTDILEADILGYWTYIPRYKYQVQRFSPTDPPSCGPAATNNPGQVTGTCSDTLADGLYGPRNFNIEFQKSTDQIATPTQTGDWATHPAFTLGTAELNGIWVGKFETTGTSTAPTIKPNQTSLKSQTISNQFNTAKLIGKIAADGTSTTSSNTHNFASNVDTFQFNNKHWGATIYLATSTYGAGDQTFANSTNLNDYGIVAKNANSNYVTGCGPAADHNDNSTYSGGTTCTPTSDNINRSYYTTLGRQASTTQNVYGVYDMSGGAWEYTLSNYSNGTDIGRPSSSGLTAGSTGQYFSGIANKYFTLYNSTIFTNNTYYGNYNQCTYTTCGGQGLYETTFVASVSSSLQSWSRDYSYFVDASSPWARRGGYYYDAYSAGLFGSNIDSGDANSYIGFRAGATVW
jgi:hypothetical protein